VQGLSVVRTAICLALSVVTACQQAPANGSLLSGDITPGSGGTVQAGLGSAMRGSGHQGSGARKQMAPDIDLDSKDILGRTATEPVVYVKHVLLAWADLLPVYGKRIDARASKRTNADAAKTAKEVFDKLKAAPDTVDAVVKEHSEDPGSLTGEPYKVVEKSGFVPEFKKLATRLQLKEVGIVKTKFGYHVMIRVAKPPYDPIESAAILDREPKSEMVEVQHILIGWKDAPAAKDPRAKAREKADADKLAKEVLAKVAGGDMAKLMKEFSEDPGSKDTGRAYSVTEDEPLVEQFKTLALRLDVNEAGIVKTEFGFHIIKRIKPDSLQSADILARKLTPDQEKEKAKIKYILLGWKEAHLEDDRGKKRERADLEKLVKDTLARAAKKETRFEDLMKELSEDTQSGLKGLGVEATMQGFPPMLKMIGLRLKMDEIGVVKTQFGMFIVKRVADTAAPQGFVPGTPAPKVGSGSGSAAPPKAQGSGSAAPPKAQGSGSAAPKAPGSGSAK
jgi:parvulin-like peptidyl-prolyl isomerase